MFARILYLTETSVLESVRSTFGHKFLLAEATLWKLPEGFQITLFGLLLIAIFISRMAFGLASLPVTLRSARISRGDPEAWQHLKILVFVLVGPFFLVGLLFPIPLLVSTRLLVYAQSVWFGRLDPALESVVALAVLLCIIRREDRQTILESIRWPDRISVLLSLIFPVGTGVLISVGNFLVDRTLWAAHDFWRLSPPEFGSYLDIADPYFLLLFFAAFFEEIIFRGLLQNRFIQRYGMYRGMFFVGIVWAAFHFFSDFSFSRTTDLTVLEHLGMRMFMCTTLSYVLGWLTLRSRSVIPATVAHALYNILVFSDFGPLFPGKDNVRVSLWAVLAWVLFRYWPVDPEGSPELSPELQNPESAV
jgi:membrane protease YdiL (CAAX protease family)